MRQATMKGLSFYTIYVQRSSVTTEKEEIKTNEICKPNTGFDILINLSLRF